MFRVREALRQAGREDLIGPGPECLVPSRPPAATSPPPPTDPFPATTPPHSERLLAQTSPLQARRGRNYWTFPCSPRINTNCSTLAMAGGWSVLAT